MSCLRLSHGHYPGGQGEPRCRSISRATAARRSLIAWIPPELSDGLRASSRSRLMCRQRRAELARLGEVGRRQLRSIPDNGFGYGPLRYLGSLDIRERLSPHGNGPQISFNYLGRWDAWSEEAGGGLYRSSHGSLGQDHDPADGSSHILEIVGNAEVGRLAFFWYHQPGLHGHSTIESVAGDFVDVLRSIARDCQGGS